MPAIIQQAERALAEARPRTGGVRFRCTPESAEVSLDGVPQGRCSDFSGQRGLPVPPGLLRVELTKEGYWPYVTYIESDGALLVLDAKLAPIASSPPSR